MNLICHNLFPTPVFNTDLDGIDNEVIEKYAYELRTLDREGAGKPLEDGWQSKDVSPKSLAMYDLLMGKIGEAMAEGCKQLGIPGLVLTKTWININPPKTYIDAHKHEGSVYSGVYYVKVPENSGDICFNRDDDAKYFLPKISQGGHSFLASRADLPGRPNLLLLFPSWLSHKVSLNNSKEDRISVSFNFGISVADGS